MAKVYCNSCKHRKPWSAAMGCCGNYCKVNKTRITTPMTEYDQLMDCEEVNANNDCTKYEINWLNAWIKRFKTKKKDVVKDRFELMDL